MSVVVYLIDDGSTDGTSAAVQAEFPTVRLSTGDGTLYWAGGMRRVYGQALQEKHDYYLWLNDDVELYEDALARAISTSEGLIARFGGEHLIVGAMQSPDGAATTYSGFIRSSRLLPWKLEKIDPRACEAVECDTVNGNFVLIPSSLARRIGNIHPAYIQMHADLELGFVARKLGGRNWIMPGFAGVCAMNPGRKKWNEPGLPFLERLRLMRHPLGYPLKPNIAYSRNFGLWAPVAIAAPYVTLLTHYLFKRSSSRSESREEADGSKTNEAVF